jgi:2-dehydropantoate 2-reductase
LPRRTFVFKNLLLRVQKIDPQARSSMADDLAAGRETEIDHLNGEIVRLAERLGRDAPVNRAIVDLIKQREAGVEQLWNPEQLRRYVLEGHRGVALFGY